MEFSHKVCEIGYREESQGAGCTACPSKSASLAGSIGFTFLLIFALLVLFIIIWRSRPIPVPKESAWTEVKEVSLCFTLPFSCHGASCHFLFITNAFDCMFLPSHIFLFCASTLPKTVLNPTSPTTSKSCSPTSKSPLPC